MEEFELVIVGAGSAGCIVANQLISKTNFKVLLIEAGPSDNNPVVKIPLGYGMTFYNKKLNWNFYSKKQKNLSNREIYFPRGKVVGGSGSINAMIYARGLNTDFEEWSQNKNDIWSWSSINESFTFGIKSAYFMLISFSRKLIGIEKLLLLIGERKSLLSYSY